MQELEWHQMELTFAGLRLSDGARRARLVASLVQHGQQNPVWVVERARRYVLIDGYERVAALKELGRDTVQAVVLPLDEAEALIYRWSASSSGRGTAVEEGWLLRELRDSHHLAQAQLALRFTRSVSWISRRLSLVETLPSPVETLLRQGAVSTHAAMKWLVPLARAKVDHAERLAAGLAGAKLSTRQVERLYRGWRIGNETEREAIVGAPLLYLRAVEELAGAAAKNASETPAQSLARDLEILANVSLRARQRYRKQLQEHGGLAADAALGGAWDAARSAFYRLDQTLSGEVSGDARS